MNERQDGQPSDEGFVGLAAALEVLRSELQAAWEAGRDKRVRFRVSQLTVTMQIVARRELEAGGKLRWYVLEAGGGAKSAAEATQAIELTLAPALFDEQGNLEPLDVYGTQPQPGG